MGRRAHETQHRETQRCEIRRGDTRRVETQRVETQRCDTRRGDTRRGEILIRRGKRGGGRRAVRLPRRRSATATVLAVTLGAAAFLSAGPIPAAAAPADVSSYLGLPMPNRDASAGPGGVNPALPTSLDDVRTLLDAARGSGAAPAEYAALLQQYWLVAATEAAGIDLASWDPRTGAQANRTNLIRSYRYYEDLQLAHRELTWAGMAGLVGADFGGGMLDLELGGDIFGLPGIAQQANTIIGNVVDAFGPGIVDRLPAGLPAVARVGASITPEDIHQVIEMILVMQKNIFSDLMPMHRAYLTGGLPALAEMQAAGLFGSDIMSAWQDIASGDPGRIDAGNAALLQREQKVVIGAQWDEVRGFRGDVGLALTYLSTVAGSPSVAGALPPREYHSVVLDGTLADGRTAMLSLPLPNWNWSVFDERWSYILDQVLPSYSAMRINDWPQLEAELREPYEIRIEQHRPLFSLPSLFESAVRATTVTVE